MTDDAATEAARAPDAADDPSWTARLRDGREVLVRRARPDDDAAACRLFASITQDADLQLSVDRSPSLNGLYRLQGDVAETWLGEIDGELVGMGTFSVRDAYVGGELRRVGYLGDLRLKPQVRGRALVSTFFGDVLDSFARRHGVEVFLTAVIGPTERPARALTSEGSRELGVPEYHLVKDLKIRAIHLLQPKPRLRSAVRVAAAGADDIDEVAAFLDADARTRLWGNPMSAERLREHLHDWPGLDIGDFLVARDRNGTVVGTMALWDASPVKRTHVVAYRNSMRRVRRLYDLVATVSGGVRLPAPGGQLRYVYATHYAVPSGDVDIHRALMRAAYRRMRRTGNVFISCCVSETNGAEGAARGYVKNDLSAHLYAIVPNGGPLPSEFANVNARPLGFEAALV